MDLTARLAKIPRPRLADLVGHQVVEALDELAVVKTNRQLAEVLQDLYGSDLFRIDGILRALVLQLSPIELNHLGGDINDWLTHKWVANARTELLAGVLGVNAYDYLPSTPGPVQVDRETVVPCIDVDAMAADPQHAGYRMFPLHSYQKAVKDAFIAKLVQPGARFLVHMPTGSGKTKTAIEGLVDFWRAKGRNSGFIIWLAHSKELCEQAYDTFRSIWRARGDFPLTITKVFHQHSSDLRSLDSGVAFIGFQKLHSWIQRGTPSAIHIRDNTRVVVVDEAHKALAPTYDRCIEYLTDNSPTRLVGLTATPGRGHDVHANQRFVNYFSNNIYGVDYDSARYESAIAYLQAHDYLAQLRRIPLRTNVRLSAEDIAAIDVSAIDLPERILTRLSTDASRNLLIVSEIKRAVFDRSDATLVFATSIEHAAVLRVLLQREHIDARCVFGTTPQPQRSRYIAAFRADALPVLINYDVLTTGFDAPNLGTLVIARPTTSVILYSQMLGRALRGPRMGGRSGQNTIVDLVDNNGRFGNEHAAFTHFQGYFEDTL